MKGIVCNLLGEAIWAGYGEDTWDGRLQSAELGGAYTPMPASRTRRG